MKLLAQRFRERIVEKTVQLSKELGFDTNKALVVLNTERGKLYGTQQYFLPTTNPKGYNAKDNFDFLWTNGAGAGAFQVETFWWSKERDSAQPCTAEQIRYNWSKNILAGITALKKT